MESFFIVVSTALATAVSMLWVFTSWARRGSARNWGRLGAWTVLGYVTTLPAIFVMFVLGGLGFSSSSLFVLVVPTFGAAAATWLVIFPGSGDRAGRWPWFVLLGIPGGGLLAFGGFLVWSGGVIPWHDLALGWAVVLFIGAVAITVYAALRSSRSKLGYMPPPLCEDRELPSTPGAAIPWIGTAIISAGTLFAALVFQLPFHLVDEGPNGPLWRLLIAAAGMGVALVAAGARLRRSGAIRYGLAGLGVSALTGPGIGAMMVLAPTPPARTLLRLALYVLYWLFGVVSMFAVGWINDAPWMLALAFGVLLTVSPFCVPVADWWAVHRRKRFAGI